MSLHQREIISLTRALSIVGVSVVESKISRHHRIKIQHIQKRTCGNITLSLSPSDINVQRQRERQIRRELIRLGVDDPHKFCWRQL